MQLHNYCSSLLLKSTICRQALKMFLGTPFHLMFSRSNYFPWVEKSELLYIPTFQRSNWAQAPPAHLNAKIINSRGLPEVQIAAAILLWATLTWGGQIEKVRTFSCIVPRRHSEAVLVTRPVALVLVLALPLPVYFLPGEHFPLWKLE